MNTSSILLIFLSYFVLITVHFSLDKNYGTICQIPLRKKLIIDTSNISFFILILLYQILNMKKNKVIIVLLLDLTLVSIFFFKNGIKKILISLSKKIRIKIAYGSTFTHLFRQSAINSLKNWGQEKKPPKDNELHKSKEYREIIILTIVLFCKRITLLSLFLNLFHAFISIEDIKKLIPDPLATILTAYTPLEMTNIIFLLIINIGLIFSLEKFYSDYKEISTVQIDNPRFLTIIKQLERNEHEI